MPIAETSQTRLSYVTEVVVGTTPASPVFQNLRYLSSDVRVRKEVNVPDEIRGDGNVSQITDIGRVVDGTINGLLSYGTYDAFFESLFRAAWAANVLKNGIIHNTFTLENTFEQGAVDSFIRYRAARVNQLDLQLTAKQDVKANWGIVGVDSPAPTNAILTLATYVAANTNPVINSGANVAALTVTGIATSPKIRSLSLQIKSNLYANDVVGSYSPDSHGLGRFEVTGSMEAYFENLDLYNGIIGHTDLTLTMTLGSSTGLKYTLLLPKVKALDGGPEVPGNSQSVMHTVPFQAFYDSASLASMTLTRAVA